MWCKISNLSPQTNLLKPSHVSNYYQNIRLEFLDFHMFLTLFWQSIKGQDHQRYYGYITVTIEYLFSAPIVDLMLVT